MSDKALELALEAKGVFVRADAEGREPTAEERAYVEQLLDQAAREKSRQRLDAIGRQIGPPGGSNGLNRLDPMGAPPGGGPGDVFVQSAGFKSLFGPGGARGESWSTGMIEVSPPPGQMMMKGTLLEGAGSPGAGTGGGLLPVPQAIPGAVQTLFQPLHVEDLLLAGIADGNTVRYVLEGTATSGAAGVAEGGAKPESILGLSTKDEPVKKVATFLPVSDELMEDVPSIQAYLNGRLSLFVNIEVERQLLRGTSGGNEVQGLLTSRSVPVFTGGTADTKAVQMFKALNSMRGSAFIEPEWIIMHPTDYQIIRLLTDTAGQFFGGGPFMGAYGNPTQVDLSNQVGNATDQLWGKPCLVTAALGGAGTALIGTRANAQVWSRGGLRVEATNSHASFFQNDLVAIRAERRLALTVLRSNGFVECRLAVGPGG